MKHLIRAICVILMISLMPALPVSADAGENQRGSLFFVSYNVYIYKTSDTSFQACYEVLGKDTMQEIGAISLKIQQSDDGESWSTIRTYTTEYYPQMICENTIYHEWWFGYPAKAGYCYRLEVVLWAKNSMGSGERTVYSEPMWF